MEINITPRSNSPKIHHLLLCGALTVGLGVAAPAMADNVTTNIYSSTSDSEDIAESCKGADINGTSGVVSITCNKEGQNNDDTFDMNDVIRCKDNPNSTVKEGILEWGTAAYDGDAKNWEIGLSYNNEDYIVSAQCQMSGWIPGTTVTRTHLDLGDTVKGMKNYMGELKKR